MKRSFRAADAQVACRFGGRLALRAVPLVALAAIACSSSSGASGVDGAAGTDSGARDGAPDHRSPSDAKEAGRADARDATQPDASGGQDAGHDVTKRPDASDAGHDAVVSQDAGHDVVTAHDASSDAHAATDAHDAGVDTGPPPPALLSLAVSPLQLYPAFAPSIHDYYVRCAAGSNALDVTADAATGEKVTITQPSASGPATHLQKSFALNESQAVVVNAVQGTTTVPYWVRCLPHDFPALQMQLYPEVGAPTAGYYLVGNVFKSSNVPGEGGYAMALDVNGVPVWYGKTVNNGGAKNPDLIAPNTISYIPIAGYTFGTYNGSFELHSLNPVGVTYVTSVGEPIDTHELRKLPNGDYLVFTDKIDTRVDLTQLNADGGTPKFNSDEASLNCIIQEVSPAGEKVWEWKGTDHFNYNESVEQDSQGARYVADAGLPPQDGGNVTVWDPFHCNSIDWDPVGDPTATKLLISARNLDAIFLLDRATGKVLWKLGGVHTATNKDHPTEIQIVGDPQQGFHRQHHVRFVGDGTITIFDDHGGVGQPVGGTPPTARGMQISYDESAGTASVVWQAPFVAAHPSIGMGSVQAFPDGTHVVGWGYPPGGNQLQISEYDPAGNVVLEFTFPDNPESSYRALKYSTDQLDLDTMRASIGPWSTGNGIPVDAGSDGG